MRFIYLLILLPFLSAAQPITAVQQKALNAYVDYANQSADEVTNVVKSIIQYYPSIRQKSSWGSPRYTCPVQLDDYYFNNAVALNKNLSAAISGNLLPKLKELRASAEKIDAQCKALDTYHKLEDYKQDNFAKAEQLINDLPALLNEYQKKQNILKDAFDAIQKKGIATASAAYRNADAFMRGEIERERNFLGVWAFNLKQDIHTGWPVDKLEQSILDTDRQAAAMLTSKPALKYPASSMWSSFQENLLQILEIKRRALNEYNFEAKKSDKHSNDVYLELINYLNGTLVADYNSFIQFAMGDNYNGVKALKYFPRIDIRTQPASTAVVVKPFDDVPHAPIAIATQKTALPKAQYNALVNYVTYINETWRQTRNLQSILENFNSSAAYFRTLDSYERHGALHFDYANYQIPKAEYQKTIADSRILQSAIAKSLNDQATIIQSILKELDDLSASIAIEVSEKQYEKDRLANIYKMLERQKVLFQEWDNRKEQLYTDVRKVFDAYPASATNSWYISGKALRNLADLDREALFKAKAYYTGDTTMKISTTAIDENIRDVIAREYDNMKGIQKIGRNNGLCPYTPYEDLPETSKSFSEELRKLRPAGNKSRYDHPYYKLIYHYNDIVDDYNKFCELSTQVQHLPTVHQPELFILKYPEAKNGTAATKTSASNPPVVKASENQVTKNENTQQGSTRPSSSVKVLHDTVYIEKRDTVYLSDAGEDIRSMEGYATNNMVLLLDVSGSMNAAEKLPLLKNSIISLLSMMRPEDRISIIAFSDKPKVLLESASFKDEDKINKAINSLKSSGKTDGNAGIKLAYKTADENYIRGGNNRIVLATDGEFATSDETLQLISKFSKEDIFLSIFNFGKGVGASKALQQLTTLGNGNYAQISKENVDMKLIREAKAKKKK
jgi:Ca-activated chloride channel family protein